MNLLNIPLKKFYATEFLVFVINKAKKDKKIKDKLQPCFEENVYTIGKRDL